MEFSLIQANGIDISAVKIHSIEEKLVFNLRKSQDNIKAKFTEVVQVANIQSYEGQYIVDPKFVEQKLETAHKIMTDDVTVKQIPYAEVDNQSGGTTFYIGRIK